MSAYVVQLVVLLTLPSMAKQTPADPAYTTVDTQLPEQATDRSLSLKVEDSQDRGEFGDLGVPRVPSTLRTTRHAPEIADAAPRDAVAMHAGRGPPSR